MTSESVHHDARRSTLSLDTQQLSDRSTAPPLLQQLFDQRRIALGLGAQTILDGPRRPTARTASEGVAPRRGGERKTDASRSWYLKAVWQEALSSTLLFFRKSPRQSVVKQCQ